MRLCDFNQNQSCRQKNIHLTLRGMDEKCKTLHVPQEKTHLSVTGCPCLKAKNLLGIVLHL